MNENDPTNPCCEEATVRPNNKIRDIVIKQLDYGYTVIVGCQTFAIEDKDKLLRNLTEYLGAPGNTEKEWLSNGLLK
jgi:hypothetical protein